MNLINPSNTIANNDNMDGIPLFAYGKAAANKFEKLGIDPAKDFRSLRRFYPNWISLKNALSKRNLYLNAGVRKSIKNLYNQNGSLVNETDQVTNSAIVTENDEQANESLKFVTLNTVSDHSIAPEFNQRPQQRSLNVEVANQLINHELQNINGPQTSTVLPQDVREVARGLPVYDVNSLIKEANRFDDTALPSNQIFVEAVQPLSSSQVIGESIALAELQPTLLDPENGMVQSERSIHTRSDSRGPTLSADDQSRQSATSDDLDYLTWKDYLPDMTEHQYLHSKIDSERREEASIDQWKKWHDKSHKIDFQNPLELAHLNQKAIMYYEVEKTNPLPPVFRGGSMNDGCKMYGTNILKPFEIAHKILTKEDNTLALLSENVLNTKNMVNKDWVRKNVNSAKATLLEAHFGNHTYEPNRWIVAYPPPGIKRIPEGQFRSDSGSSSYLREDALNVNSKKLPSVMNGYFIPSKNNRNTALNPSVVQDFSRAPRYTQPQQNEDF